MTSSSFLENKFEIVKYIMNYSMNNNKAFVLNFEDDNIINQENKSKVLNCLEFTDIVFCDKFTGLAFAEHMYDELGLENYSANLLDIAKAISQYQKRNLKRQRICIITDFMNPVIFALTDFKTNKVFFERVKFDEISKNSS